MGDSRVMYFGAHGLKSQNVQIAPEDTHLLPDSKRKILISQEDSDLDKNLNVLDIGTKSRNRAFQDRLDEVWSSMAGWEAKLKTEAVEAVDTITQLRQDYEIQIDKFSKSLQDEIAAIYNKFDNELIPNENMRVEKEEKSLDVFVHTTVPEALDRQTGVLTRQLKKAYESYEIELQKQEKREKKFVIRCNEHLQNTAQRMHDEAALLDSCFYNLEDDVQEYERRSIRSYYRRHYQAVQNVMNLNHVLADVGKLRESEDLEVLDTVIETQTLLQQIVLLHFGSDESIDLDAVDIRFPRLEKRLDQQRHRKEHPYDHSKLDMDK